MKDTMRTPLTSLPSAQQSVLDSVRVATDNGKAAVRKLTFRFRWPCVVEQTGDGQTVSCLVPCGLPGVAPLATGFINQFHLSDAEIEKAETAVLRSVALIQD